MIIQHNSGLSQQLVVFWATLALKPSATGSRLRSTRMLTRWFIVQVCAIIATIHAVILEYIRINMVIV